MVSAFTEAGVVIHLFQANGTVTTVGQHGGKISLDRNELFNQLRRVDWNFVSSRAVYEWLYLQIKGVLMYRSY
jgi:hypothetical protein